MSDFLPQKPWTLFTTIRDYLLRPRKSFAAVSDKQGILPPLIFVATLFVFCAILRAAALLAVGIHLGISALLSPIFLELLWFCISTLGLYLALRAVRRKPAAIDTTLRLMAYSLAPWIFSPLWILLPGMAGEIALLVILVAIIGVMFAGLRSIYELTPPLAAAVIIIDMVLVMLVAAAVQQISVGA